MGSSASKVSRLAGTTASKRKYPQRVPSSSSSPSAAAAAGPPPHRGTTISPSSHPNLQASTSQPKGKKKNISKTPFWREGGGGGKLFFPPGATQNISLVLAFSVIIGKNVKKNFTRLIWIRQQSTSTSRRTRLLPDPFAPSVPSPLPPPSPPLSTITNHPAPPPSAPTQPCRSSPRGPASRRRRSENSRGRAAPPPATAPTREEDDGSWMWTR